MMMRVDASDAGHELLHRFLQRQQHVSELLSPTPANVNTIHLPGDELLAFIAVEHWLQQHLGGAPVQLLGGSFVLVQSADLPPPATAQDVQAAASIPWRLRQVAAVELGPPGSDPAGSTVVLVGGDRVSAGSVGGPLESAPDYQYLCCELAALQEARLMSPLKVYDVAHVAWRLRTCAELEAAIAAYSQEQAELAAAGYDAEMLQQAGQVTRDLVQGTLRRLPPLDWVSGQIMQYIELKPYAWPESPEQPWQLLSAGQYSQLIQAAAAAWGQYVACIAAGQQPQPVLELVPWAPLVPPETLQSQQCVHPLPLAQPVPASGLAAAITAQQQLGAPAGSQAAPSAAAAAAAAALGATKGRQQQLQQPPPPPQSQQVPSARQQQQPVQALQHQQHQQHQLQQPPQQQQPQSLRPLVLDWGPVEDDFGFDHDPYASSPDTGSKQQQHTPAAVGLAPHTAAAAVTDDRGTHNQHHNGNEGVAQAWLQQLAVLLQPVPQPGQGGRMIEVSQLLARHPVPEALVEQFGSVEDFLKAARGLQWVDGWVDGPPARVHLPPFAHRRLLRDALQQPDSRDKRDTPVQPGSLRRGGRQRSRSPGLRQQPVPHYTDTPTAGGRSPLSTRRHAAEGSACRHERRGRRRRTRSRSLSADRGGRSASLRTRRSRSRSRSKSRGAAHRMRRFSKSPESEQPRHRGHSPGPSRGRSPSRSPPVFFPHRKRPLSYEERQALAAAQSKRSRAEEQQMPSGGYNREQQQQQQQRRLPPPPPSPAQATNDAEAAAAAEAMRQRWLRRLAVLLGAPEPGQRPPGITLGDLAAAAPIPAVLKNTFGGNVKRFLRTGSELLLITRPGNMSSWELQLRPQHHAALLAAAAEQEGGSEQMDQQIAQQQQLSPYVLQSLRPPQPQQQAQRQLDQAQRQATQQKQQKQEQDQKQQEHDQRQPVRQQDRDRRQAAQQEQQKQGRSLNPCVRLHAAATEVAADTVSNNRNTSSNAEQQLTSAIGGGAEPEGAVSAAVAALVAKAFAAVATGALATDTQASDAAPAASDGAAGAATTAATAASLRACGDTAAIVTTSRPKQQQQPESQMEAAAATQPAASRSLSTQQGNGTDAQPPSGSSRPASNSKRDRGSDRSSRRQQQDDDNSSRRTDRQDGRSSSRRTDGQDGHSSKSRAERDKGVAASAGASDRGTETDSRGRDRHRQSKRDKDSSSSRRHGSSRDRADRPASSRSDAAAAAAAATGRDADAGVRYEGGSWREEEGHYAPRGFYQQPAPGAAYYSTQPPYPGPMPPPPHSSAGSGYWDHAELQHRGAGDRFDHAAAAGSHWRQGAGPAHPSMPPGSRQWDAEGPPDRSAGPRPLPLTRAEEAALRGFASELHRLIDELPPHAAFTDRVSLQAAASLMPPVLTACVPRSPDSVSAAWQVIWQHLPEFLVLDDAASGQLWVQRLPPRPPAWPHTY